VSNKVIFPADVPNIIGLGGGQHIFTFLDRFLHTCCATFTATAQSNSSPNRIAQASASSAHEHDASWVLAARITEPFKSLTTIPAVASYESSLKVASTFICREFIFGRNQLESFGRMALLDLPLLNVDGLQPNKATHMVYNS
jgi:hypothetical protein